jgi:hypothetical protein
VRVAVTGAVEPAGTLTVAELPDVVLPATVQDAVVWLGRPEALTATEPEKPPEGVTEME